MLHTAWFIVLVTLVAGYAVLDGFDLGVGALHLLLPRGDAERTVAIETIGPVWNGNEVWLVAAGGAMFAAFPLLYASAFSGFYLPLMLVLWLLVFRGLGIEFRHQVDHLMWRQAWDVAFTLASALLAFILGVAFANVLRGVPLDDGGRFEGTFGLVLNPFSLTGGALGLLTLAMHGSAWLAFKTTGELRVRAQRTTDRLWASVVFVLLSMTTGSFRVRPNFIANFERWPVLLALPLVTLAALVTIRWTRGTSRDGLRFAATSAFIVGVLASAAAGLYPRLLPTPDGARFLGLDIYNAAAPDASLRTALWLYGLGLALVSAYLVRSYRTWSGRVSGTH